MDIFEKYAAIGGRHAEVLKAGNDPFAVSLETILSPTEAIINGRHTHLVGTNNYLGLTFDGRAIEAAVEAVRASGTGTTGSRIANGTYDLHKKLESEFAAAMGRERCIVFTTGYQANLAMLCGLAGPDDVILVDADSHASIYDGCKLSGATIIRFRHNDPLDLDKRLTRLKDHKGAKLVVIEGLYSMLGDTAPVDAFVEVKDRHGAYLLVDEAHSFGVFGAHGRGVAEAQGVEKACDFIVGTFSKSLGGIGGFAVSDHPKFDMLRYCARPYMFTASPNPASIAPVRETLKRITAEPELRTRIWAAAAQLHDGLAGLGFDLASPTSPVVAIKLPDEASAVWAWNRLLSLGVYVNLALPPGTPSHLCLLRCSVSAAHTKEQITEVLRRFETLAGELAAAHAAE